MVRALQSTAARLVITAAILAYLLWNIDLHQTVAALLHVNPWWFAATMALVALDRVLMILRWVVLLRSAGVHLPIRSSVYIYLVSSFVGSFLPAGVGSDASRAYAVAARTTRGADAVASVAIDRVLGLPTGHGAWSRRCAGA
jgi:uncharacterized protein (TIRG00374 family)